MRLCGYPVHHQHWFLWQCGQLNFIWRNFSDKGVLMVMRVKSWPGGLVWWFVPQERDLDVSSSSLPDPLFASQLAAGCAGEEGGTLQRAPLEWSRENLPYVNMLHNVWELSTPFNEVTEEVSFSESSSIRQMARNCFTVSHSADKTDIDESEFAY